MATQEAQKGACVLLNHFGLGGFERFWLHELSGGMHQRLVLARPVSPERLLLLLDEPFSGLDVLTCR